MYTLCIHLLQEIFIKRKNWAFHLRPNLLNCQFTQIGRNFPCLPLVSLVIRQLPLWLSPTCFRQAQDGLPDCQRRRNSLNEACCPKFEEQRITSPKKLCAYHFGLSTNQGKTACFENFSERVDNLTSISSLAPLSIKYIPLYIFIFHYGMGSSFCCHLSHELRFTVLRELHVLCTLQCMMPTGNR